MAEVSYESKFTEKDLFKNLLNQDYNIYLKIHINIEKYLYACVSISVYT